MGTFGLIPGGPGRGCVRIEDEPAETVGGWSLLASFEAERWVIPARIGSLDLVSAAGARVVVECDKVVISLGANENETFVVRLVTSTSSGPFSCNLDLSSASARFICA